MKRWILCLSFLLSIALKLTSAELSHHVLVSVAPHKFFVEKIAGQTVSVGLMVPAGASAHTYEPTPKQMLAASKADMWFTVGEIFETRAIQAISAYNPNFRKVDLRQGVDMISANDELCTCRCHGSHTQDLHIWLSARQAKIQAATIAEALSLRYPEYRQHYMEALTSFTNELDALDQEINFLLSPLKQRIVMVSHPAYAYFCRDYRLTQMSIECEGKDPTPQQLTQILTKARAIPITRIYIQPQYNSKGAKLFAQELKAQVVTLDPYAEDYLQSMLQIAQQFSQN